MQEWSAGISGLLIISFRVVYSIVCYLRSLSLPPSFSETLSPSSSSSPSLAAAGTSGAGGGRAVARAGVHDTEDEDEVPLLTQRPAEKQCKSR